MLRACWRRWMKRSGMRRWRRWRSAVEGASAELLAANAEDCAGCEGERAELPATLARLKLDEAKLAEMVEQVRSVAQLPDPLGRVLDAMELDEGLDLARRSACRWVCWR